MFPINSSLQYNKINNISNTVRAFNLIPQASVSSAIPPEKLLENPISPSVLVEINSNGHLDLESKSKTIWNNKTHWVRALKLADDCHSCNIQLKLIKNNNLQSEVILETLKTIDVQQELLLWFSEDILTMLDIAYLNPSTIQGYKKYVCNQCGFLYESPNPLKLHIALQCGRYGIERLWSKLAHFLHSQEDNVIDLTTQKSRIKLDTHPSSSAFRPFRKAAESSLGECDEKRESFKFGEYDEEAQLETFFSSFGKTKQGHLCLYCGKCYSRKYGLKIHLRTHTGYKPLKCKYCSRPFGDPSNLNKHVRLHAEGNTPYKCELCGKILVRRRDLDRHLKSRHMLEIHPDLNV